MEEAPKVILEKKHPEIEEFDYNGANIKLNPFISAELELSLIKLYLEKYFTPNHDETLSYLKEGYYDYWLAEYSVKRTILEKLTNIDVYETNTDTIVDIFLSVSSKIKNYGHFRYRLDEMVQAVKDSKSTGIVIDSLVSKGLELFESFKSIDPVKMKELADTIIGKMENSTVSGAFQETSQESQSKKQTKTKKTKEPKVE